MKFVRDVVVPMIALVLTVVCAGFTVLLMVKDQYGGAFSVCVLTILLGLFVYRDARRLINL